MAKEIGPIAKPHIWLEGNLIVPEDEAIGTWAGRVDHAKNEPVTSMNIIGGVTQYDQTDIITFDYKVRVIITGQAQPKFNYYTQNNSLPLDDNIFEGSAEGYKSGSLEYGNIPVNNYAETYFTINGKSPVRTKAYLWKYLDTDDRDKAIRAAASDPSNADVTWAGFGFILGSCQTGSDLITIKAKTYFRGNESRVAIAKFKIARHGILPDGTILPVENGVPIEGV